MARIVAPTAAIVAACRPRLIAGVPAATCRGCRVASARVAVYGGVDQLTGKDFRRRETLTAGGSRRETEREAEKVLTRLLASGSSRGQVRGGPPRSFEGSVSIVVATISDTAAASMSW